MTPNYVPQLTQKLNGLSVGSTGGSPGLKNKVPLKIISLCINARHFEVQIEARIHRGHEGKRELSAGLTNENKRPTSSLLRQE